MAENSLKQTSHAPAKVAGKKAKRQREQKKRLVNLGMTEDAVAKLSSREVLTALKHPLKVAKAAALAKEGQTAAQ